MLGRMLRRVCEKLEMIDFTREACCCWFLLLGCCELRGMAALGGRWVAVEGGGGRRCRSGHRVMVWVLMVGVWFHWCSVLH